MLILHVTNGDSAAQGLSRSGLPGDVLAWRDVLHDGPVPPDRDRTAFWRTRAAFLADRRWTAELEVVDDFSARDARLDDPSSDDAIVLWFEPDVYDQLQLIQVLARISDRDPTARPQLFIAPADLLFGTLAPEKFKALYDVRRTITESDLAIGRRAWDAYTSDSPDALMTLVDALSREVSGRTYTSDDAVRLPHLAAALRRILEEYPDADTGLSRSERQICEALAPGATTLAKLYKASHHASESWIWLGDWSFAWYVERLSDGTYPLISHTNGTRVIAVGPAGDAKMFWDRQVMLTPYGSDVVRAKANTIDRNGIDRWIGGAHLTTARHWRWDGRMQKPVFRG